VAREQINSSSEEGLSYKPSLPVHVTTAHVSEKSQNFLGSLGYIPNNGANATRATRGGYGNSVAG
jgi:hypothetical protein